MGGGGGVKGECEWGADEGKDPFERQRSSILE